MNKIAIVTGSRAEWGLLESLAKAIGFDVAFDFKVIITGSHLSPEFGMTKNEIIKTESHCYSPFEKIETLISSDTVIGTCKSMGLVLISFSELYERLKPDMIIVSGDRYEILAATIAAYNMHIPIAHIHGGETTEGSLDDAYRHSITHMSQLHFTAHEQYRQKVIQLGKDSDTVFDVGCLCLQDLPKPIYPKNKKQIILLFHPETVDYEASKRKFHYLTNVLLYEPFEKIYAIGSNADCGGMYINQCLEDIARTNDTVIYLPSIRRSEFLELLNESIAIVGNSSCGIYEAPALGTATINVGMRQDGRLKADSILDCPGTPQSIEAALDVLYSEEFQKSLKNIKGMPYRGGNVSGCIIKEIKYYFDKK
jgi:GDP/UDP-N,N'-diacetylbacillosamine 2-epimerase (hydrolysing)